MYRLLLLAVLISFTLPCSAFAANYDIIAARSVANDSGITHIDPIIDGTGELRGLIYCYRHRFSAGVLIDLFGNDTLLRPQLWSLPISTVNRVSGDSLIIYVDTDAEARFDNATTIYRLILVGNQLFIDSIDVLLPHPDDYDNVRAVHQRVDFSRSPSGQTQGIILEKQLEYVDYELANWETFTYQFGRTHLFDLDLTAATLVEYNTTGLSSGKFDTLADAQFIATYIWFYDFDSPYMPSHSEGSALFVTPGSPVSFNRNLSYGSHWVKAGDASPAYPFDELLYYGHSVGLDGAHIPATDYLGCYNLSTGSAHELWYLPISGIEPDYPYFLGLRLTAWRGDSTLLFIDLANGSVTDSVAFGVSFESRTTFALPGEFPLYGAVRKADSVFVYRFDVVTDVSDDSEPSLPSDFSLSQNYPNPFNSSTEIRFSLPRANDIELTIYNLIGQEVKTVAVGNYTAGEHRLSWDGRDNAGNECASGVYLYRLSTDQWSGGKKMLLLK
jgi:hypothetical protein